MRTVVFFLIGIVTVSQSFAATTFDKGASPLQLSAHMQYADNANPTTDEENSAALLVLAAKGQLTSNFDYWWLQLDYAAENQQLQLDNADLTVTDSYQQGHLGLVSRWHISNHWYVDVGAKVLQQDERIGSGLSSLRRNVVVADTKRSQEFYGQWAYGKEVSSRNVALSYTHKSLEYADHNAYAPLFDMDQQTLAANITFAMSSAAKFVMLLEHQQDDYDSEVRVDSRMQRVMLGMDWQPSGSSSMSLLVGQYQRQPQVGDKTNGVTWQMRYQYAPRDDFRTSIISSKSSVAGESELASDSLRQQWRINMDYLYSEQWHYGWYGLFNRTDYQEISAVRSIHERAFSVWAQLNFRDYHALRLSLRHHQSDESNGLFDYQQNEVNVSWQYEF